MEYLYLQIRSLNLRWEVSYEKGSDLIKISQGGDILFRIYKNIGSSTFFLLGDGTNASPLTEYYIVDFLSKFR